MTHRAVLTVLIAVGLAGGAQAASVPCNGQIVADSIAQESVDGGGYRYSFQVHNQTATPLKWNAWLGGFPRTVTLDSRMIAGGTLGGNASQTVHFGRGSEAAISADTVQVLYDTDRSAKAHIAVMRCVR